MVCLAQPILRGARSRRARIKVAFPFAYGLGRVDLRVGSAFFQIMVRLVVRTKNRLRGRKTYLVSCLYLGYAIAGLYFHYLPVKDGVQIIFESLIAMALRAGYANGGESRERE